MTSAPLLEIYADVWCPFAHVGLRALKRELARLGRDDLIVIVRAWPLELVSGVALDPEITNDHVRDLREQVAPDLFAGFDPSNFPITTLPALALALRGYQVSPRTGEAISYALRDALFESGRDISNIAVLDDIAHHFALDATSTSDYELVIDEWKAGQAREVKGSPHFFFNNRETFCPVLSIAHGEDGHLRLTRHAEQLATFLSTCLSE